MVGEWAERLARAEEIVARARQIVAFTGAGISSESGIPTYRDTNDAIWEKYDSETIAEISHFRRDPRNFWRFFQEARYVAMSQAEPNPGHRALAAMERAGRLHSVITQNIDGLHQQAGSQRVIELHGNTRRILCLECGERHAFEEVYEILQLRNPPPCRACGGMLKPDVVFFGEPLPAAALMEAGQAIADCDLLIAIGSSLVVYPAAALPEQAKRQGADLMLVNLTPTAYDSIADVVLPASAGEVLPALARAAGVADPI
ncbi:MAG: NAD-dependent protein deacylase [Candidatus Eisenbacteria bacterium]|nr:NAD-dependent protein deacylase [Candidatus Eisenbacteria bacterium]